jgi:hypothetical protein
MREARTVLVGLSRILGLNIHSREKPSFYREFEISKIYMSGAKHITPERNDHSCQNCVFWWI